ncbi:MAG: glycosyltransferase family 2 protein [Opitutales bacterium]
MKLSIIVTHYRMPDHLRRCLESLKHVDGDFEVVVVDDGSPAHLRTQASEITAQSERARWIESTENNGVEAAINLGLQNVIGDHVMFRGVDDLFLEKGFTGLLKHLCSEEVGRVVAGPTKYFRSNANKGIVEGEISGVFERVERDRIDTFLRGNFLNGGSVVVDTEIARDIGGQSSKLGSFADLWFNLCLMFQHGLDYLPEPFTAFRLRSDSYGNTAAARDRTPELEALAEEVGGLSQEHLKSLKASGQLHFVGAGHLLGEPKCPEDLDPHAYLGPVIRRRMERSGHLMVEWIKEHAEGRLFVYGAGSMGRWVLRVLREEGFEQVEGFLVTSKTEDAEFEGLSIHSVHEVGLTEQDLVVIASKSFEDAMVRTLLEFDPQPMLVPIWDASDGIEERMGDGF